MRKAFHDGQSTAKKVLLFIPAAIGWLIHAPLFYPIKNYVLKSPLDKEHYDSVVVAILLLAYPLYLLLLTGITFFITFRWESLLLLAVLPFFAWAHVQLKQQLD